MVIEWKPEDLAQPAFVGTRVIEPSLAELEPWIDWSPFFHTWELTGRYPAILDDPRYGDKARELFRDGRDMLDRIVAAGSLRARGVYGFFPAAGDGEDIVIYDGGHERARFYMLRQQEDKQPCLSLADFVAPRGMGDHVGAFVVTAGIGTDELVARYERDHDDYSAILVKAIADRLAEAFAEWLHKRVRDEWGYGRSEELALDGILREQYRGIRPAFGYPACPDHTEKHTLFALLGASERTGVILTEGLAMVPTASVSGMYFAHPQARYFAVGRLAEDQIEDYARRKGMSRQEVERSVPANLAY
jgi:5-methyltetrahydrofolate--homocysteine methyltransferase